MNDSLDWLFPLGDINETGYPAFIERVGALAMGATTYDWMLRRVIRPEGRPAGASPNWQPTWIFSHRELPRIDGADLRFVCGDVRPVRDEILAAAKDVNLWIVGVGDLADQISDANLLDEVIVHVGSVTHGNGKPLLTRRITSPPLRLVSARAPGVGFAALTYAVPTRDCAPSKRERDA